MDDARAHRRARFGAEPALDKPARTIRLDEHVGVAHERSELLRVCGGVEVELSRALSARGLHVEKWEGWQARRRHEEDVRAVR